MHKQENHNQEYYRSCVVFIIKSSFALSICIFILHIIAAVVIDPLQIFHRSFLFKDKLHNNMRVQAAGIINNFDFDSIILGTSRMANTSGREASQKIGGKFVNISVAGSSFFERHFILEYALKKGIKNVIYSIDPYYVNKHIETRYPIRRWAFLYDNSCLNDLKIYLSKKVFFKIYKHGLLVGKVDVDRPNRWFFRQSTEFGLEKWLYRMNKTDFSSFCERLNKLASGAFLQQDAKPSLSVEQREGLVSLLHDNIIKYIKEYPDVNFFLVLTPMHRYYFANNLFSNVVFFLMHQECIKYLVEQPFLNRNMFVFAFEDMDFLDDFENYRDTGHYHPKIDSFILDCIAQRAHMLTPENVQRYLDIARMRAESFDFVTLNNRVKELMATKSAQKHQ